MVEKSDTRLNFTPESDYEYIEIMACTNRNGAHICNRNNGIDCYKERRMTRVLKESKTVD